MIRATFSILSIVAALSAALLAGCSTPAAIDSPRAGPLFRPTNVAGLNSLGGIRRVLVMPVCSTGLAGPEIEAALDSVFRTALLNENRFEVVALSRLDCKRRFRAESLSSVSVLPRELVSVVKNEHAADAVLFVDLTAYHAYRPVTLGVRGKLMKLDGTDVAWVWGFDHVFAADDTAVANSARRFFQRAEPDGIPTDRTHLALVSPSRFATYVAATMFGTLPPVAPPALARSE